MRFAIILFLCVFSAVAGDLVPRPVKIIKDHGSAKIDPQQVKFVLPDAPVPSSALAVAQLEKYLKKLPESSGAKKVVLYLGLAGDGIFAETPLAKLKLERPQEYVLRFENDENEVRIYAAGADNQGVFYAAATLRQLITAEGLSMQDIQDYPEWKLRYTGGYNPISTAQMEQLAGFKINGFGIQHRYDWREFAPEKSPMYAKKHTYRQWFDQMKDFRERNGDLLEFMMMLNVYCGKRIDASSAEDMELLIRQCKFAAPYVQEIMIQFDDFAPAENGRYVFVSAGEKAKFKNPGQAHGYITKQVYDALQGDFPEVKISVCPAPYSLNNHNAKSASNREYLDSLSKELPAAVAIVWTGPSVESSRVTLQDHQEYRKLVNGHALYLWDNTSNMKPTPMNIWETAFFPEMSDLDGRIYVNGHGFSFFWTWLFAVNSNDYLWNPQGYDAQKSYAACFRQITGREMPEFVAHTQKDIVAMKGTPDRTARGAIAKRILDRKDEFQAAKIDFSRIERAVKPVYDECSVEFKTGTVPKLTAAPKLDAGGSDSAWTKAGTFPLAGANYGSTVKVGYTPEGLFIQFKGNYGKAAESPRKLEHDSKLDDSGDVFYICLQPPLRNQRAGWIIIDRDGNQFDYKEWQPMENFNPQIRKKIQVYGEYWILEVEIPFKELADHIMYKPPKSGEKWNINFVRRNNLDGEISTWSPAPEKDLINKKYFGTVTFE